MTPRYCVNDTDTLEYIWDYFTGETLPFLPPDCAQGHCNGSNGPRACVVRGIVRAAAALLSSQTG